MAKQDYRVLQGGVSLDSTVPQSKRREITLGECVVINDATYSPKEAWPNINYLDTGNITENRVSEIQQLKAGKDKIPSRARRKVQPGDIVYSTVRPNQKHFGLLKCVPENFLASTGFAVLRGRNGRADTGYIYWFLAQNHIVDYLHSIAENSTSAYPSIRPSDLEQLTLSLPPLAEQRMIAHVLGTLDDKIELNRRMNETLEEMARALFNSWFVDFDPVRAKAALKQPSTSGSHTHPSQRGVDGEKSAGWTVERARAYLDRMDPSIAALFPDRFVDSELGEIPEGWKVGIFGDIVSRLRNNVNPSNFQETVFSHFSIPAYDEGKVPKLELGKNIKSNKSRVPQDVVLLSKLNPEIERVWMPDVRVDEPAICSTEFLVLRARQPFTRSYICCLTRSGFFRGQIQSLVTGTSKSHQRAPADTVLSLDLVVPPPKVIETFDLLASNLLSLVSAGRQESRALAVLRDVLLPTLITGQVNVREGGKCVQ